MKSVLFIGVYFFIALLPLAAFVGAAPEHETLESRIYKTINNYPSADRIHLIDLIHSRTSKQELFDALNQGRLDGAALPYGSHVHWLFGVIAVGVFFSVLFAVSSAEGVSGKHIPTTAALTATMGLACLFTVQRFSIEAAQGGLQGAGLLSLIPIAIAVSYYLALSPESGFIASLLGFTFGVGVLEELCKLLPLLVYYRDRTDARLDWRELVVWGAASGVGFGVAEAILYSADQYNGVEPIGIYSVRFLSCVALHAVWSTTAALRLYHRRSRLYALENWYSCIPFVLWLIAPVTLLHGVYDTLLKKEYYGAAFIAALVSLAGMVWPMARAAAQTQPQAQNGLKIKMW